jgi:hypothetical protein
MTDEIPADPIVMLVVVSANTDGEVFEGLGRKRGDNGRLRSQGRGQ